jgi:phosphate transport system substrate-binding protein
VKFNRTGAVLSLLTAAALVLAGCGGTTHASSPGSGPTQVQCGGKKQLKGSGAAAQQNAMEQFVFAYVHACPGYTLDYNANGSGAGVTDFVNNVSDLAGSGDPLDPTKGQVDRAAVRFAGVGPADGVRTDCDHLQRQRRERAQTRRTHACKDFQRRHHPLG